MKTLVFIVLLSWVLSNAVAEGTKQLRPTEASYGNVEINDQGRPFALESNTDTLHRLYFYISNTSEKVYFGFQPENKIVGNGTFRIKDPSGNVVYARTNVPVASGSGYIESYNQAIAGPKIGGIPADGYNPLLFTPTTTGNFYIEFTTLLAGTYHFDLFDITVVDASNNPINGRLWSYAWDFSARGANNEFNAIMYVYTSDNYITAVNFNGMQPWGFVVSCNSKGTMNTGNPFVDRQSVEGNHTYPEYKVFLNKPDPNVYPDPVIPKMVEDLSVIGSPIVGSNVLFYLNMNKKGIVEIFLDLDSTVGYQPNNKDVVLVKDIKAGGDTIVWNGRDYSGNEVTQYVTVGVTSRFATGVTHLPIYDPEYHPKGFIVNRITPVMERAVIYWDDSQLPNGTVNLNGASGDTDGHNFAYVEGGFGNVRSMNTWWNGFENNDLKSFSFAMDGTYLPVNLVAFKAEIRNTIVNISWKTMSESNNDYFELEKSTDANNWVSIERVNGNSNSKTIVSYQVQDNSPVDGINYYRLKQVDIDGSVIYCSLISVLYNSPKPIKVSPVPCTNIITISDDIESRSYKLLSAEMVDVTHNTVLFGKSIDVSKLMSGVYYLQVNNTIIKCIKL